MSAATGDPKLIAELNGILGAELGRNIYGDPYFSWRWSEDLYWPAFATGKQYATEVPVKVPIIGGGEETVINIVNKPEYKRDRQTRRRDTWFICKWLTPWELVTGPGRGATSLRHGEQSDSAKEPPMEHVQAAWNHHFPGADLPAKGWRIPTDAYLPAGPQDENWEFSNKTPTPNYTDTRKFIAHVKFQTSRPFEEVLQDVLDKEDANNLKGEAKIGEECADMFPAFLNVKPGTRGRASGGGFVSFPWTKFDRSR